MFHKSTNLAPVILFVYNRLDHTVLTIEALKKNDLAAESELYIFSDAPKNESAVQAVNEVRSFLSSVTGFKQVIVTERKNNFGLATSIIDGVSTILEKYGKAIVLEDDLLTSRFFLRYMNEALDIFQNDHKIFSITGFSFATQFMQFPQDYTEEIYLNIRPMSWSWATWVDRWKNVDWDVQDFDQFMQSKSLRQDFNHGGTDLTRMLKKQMQGKINSWYVRWTYHAIMKHKGYTIYPRISLINNIGHDASGVHCQEDPNNIYNHTELNVTGPVIFNHGIKINQQIVKNFNKGFNTDYWRILKRKANAFLKKFS